jgi:two-component system response regulator FixJ
MSDRLTPTVYLIDDDQDMRQSLEWLFQPTGILIQTLSCAADFLSTYQNGPGCLILDINLPDANGLELARELSALQIDLPIIMITGKADIPTAVSAMKVGAIDFVPKPFDGSKLIELVRTALEKNRQQRDRRRKSGSTAKRTTRLSPRERDVMNLLVNGQTNKEIAQSLNIGVRTVETHRSEVMRKLDVKSLAELVRLVIDGNREAH